MDQDKPTGRFAPGPVSYAGETNADYRSRIALHQAEMLERRQQELQDQISPLNTPSARIRIWERLHQLTLPKDPAHRIIESIATATGLTAEDVRAEQRLRLVPVAPAASPAVSDAASIVTAAPPAAPAPPTAS
jgi:hypothetical protein